MRPAGSAACAALALFLVTAASRADPPASSQSQPASSPPTKAQCVEANAQGQALRRESKLAAARRQLVTCTDAACPGLVRSDCTARLDELEKAQPTLVLDVKDRAGDDLTAVRVTVDGELLTMPLDGSAMRFDPGQHTFKFEAEGFEPVLRTIVIKEAEKDRRERIVMKRVKVASAPAEPARESHVGEEPPVPDEGPHGFGAQRWLGIAAAGAGVAGIAVGAVFGLMASSEWNAQQSACGSPTSCPDHEGALAHHSNLTTDAAISTWTFIGGGALLAGGALIFMTAPRHAAPSAPSSGLVLAPAAGPRSAGLELTGRF